MYNLPRSTTVPYTLMPLIEMRGIIKHFPGVRALDGVNFTLERGECHSLVGENGAGKSTLMKVLSGVYADAAFEGDILVDDEPQHFRGVQDARAAGIAIIFQELSLVKELSVGENIFLGREPSHFGIIDRHRLDREAKKLLSELRLNIDPDEKVESLGIGQQQLVEIAKALSQDARILVLDEPTAALTASEVETLFVILRRLLERGVGLIYISHKLDEVFRISDRITVIRDGRTVASHQVGETNRNEVIAAMVGRALVDVFPAGGHEKGPVALEVRHLTVHATGANRKLVDNVSFKVRQGEVLGIVGLMGAGRTELLTAIFGSPAGARSGEILVDGKLAEISTPAAAISSHIGFVTEDRKRFGLIPQLSVSDNLTLAALRRITGGRLTHPSREAAAAGRTMSSLGIKADRSLTSPDTLSGGNQQKVVLGKWLLTEPQVLLLDEPTRGIDVGAKQEIYAEINQLAADGMAIVLVSSELPEVLGLSDRIIVLNNGKLSGEFDRDEATPEKLMAAATGNT